MRCWIALCISITTEADALCVLDAAGAQQAVASLALAFTPRVALLDEAVLMDVTGSLRLFGGLAKLAQALEQRIAAFFVANGAAAQVIRANGATSLIALGRLRLQLAPPEPASSAPSGGRLRVADLPMHTLSAARPHHSVLERIGCRTWDDLLRLPRDGVARRFGAELLAALDRARGQAPDDYGWIVLPEHFDERLELDALLTHAPQLMAGFERLLARLQAWLLGRQSGLCAMRLTWHLDKRRDVPPTASIDIRTDQPAQDVRHLARLASEHLARQQLAAPVHALSLQSLHTEPLLDAANATASLLPEEKKQGGSATELIERLAARLGAGQVLAWRPQADHRPEAMQRWVPAQGGDFKPVAIKSIAANARKHWATEQKGVQKPPEDRTGALYPTWLLPEPLPLATHGNSPVYQGRLQRLAGPQRIEASGWLQPGEAPGDAAAGRARPPAMRDYFIYRNAQGALLWVYSERLPPPATPGAPARPVRHWFLHGFFA
jgi:protein ImuB